ncbi:MULTISPECIES: hypothetical protein [unclassified Methylobacterium]|uniref:hypothetical protein n=1 Tax=unclassified Methylobacterium TaxID=2615210 RepID=UPI00226AB08B|nr:MULTISPECIES: hypothetical protein [unclassified Methylobacterium]
MDELKGFFTGFAGVALDVVVLCLCVCALHWHRRKEQAKMDALPPDQRERAELETRQTGDW